MAEVWVDGQDRLFANMDRCIEEVAREAKKGLKKAGMTIIADAQRNMRTAGHNGATLNNTGRLSQSGRVQDSADDDNTVEIGFFSDDGERGYAAAVEFGSKAHWAPSDVLQSWVYKKLRVAREQVASVAYLINRHMSKHGTPAHPFFTPAVKKNQRAIKSAITDAINVVTSKNLQ